MSEIIVTSSDQLEKIVEKVVRMVLKDSVFKSTPDSKNETEILSTKQAAEYLNIPQATLYFYTCKRMIPFSKKGKRVYFNKSDLSEWVESGKKKVLSF